MKYVALAVLFTVMQASELASQNTPGARASKKTQQQTQQERNTQVPVRVTELPDVTVKAPTRDWADWGVWVFNFLLVVVGSLQVWLLYRTLGAVKRQGDIAERQEAIAKEQTGIADKQASIAEELAAISKQQAASNDEQFRKQLKLAEDAAIAAQQNAAAALLNAQAVINSERPWLNVKPVSATGGAAYTFEATNYGRTPAEIMSWTCQWEIVDDELPRPPKYDTTVISPRKFLMADRQPIVCGNCDAQQHLNADGRADDVRTAKKYFMIFGRIRYYDVLNKVEPPHETRYCYRWNPADRSLLPSGPDVYNEHT